MIRFIWTASVERIDEIDKFDKIYTRCLHVLIQGDYIAFARSFASILLYSADYALVTFGLQYVEAMGESFNRILLYAETSFDKEVAVAAGQAIRTQAYYNLESLLSGKGWQRYLKKCWPKITVNPNMPMANFNEG